MEMTSIGGWLRRYLSWNTLWLLIFFILLGIFLIGMPKYIDDYNYLVQLKPWFDKQGIDTPENGGNIFKYGIPFNEIFETWSYRFNIDNTRLGNMLVVFLLLFPKWFGSSLMFICAIWILNSIIKIAGIDWKKSALVPVAIILYAFFMPWRNHLGSLDYQINYIVPMSFGLELYLQMLKKDDNWKRNAGIFILALLLGAWQEAISAPITMWLVILLLAKMRLEKKQWISLVGLLMGLGFIFCAPGQHGRFSDLWGILFDKFTLEYFFRVLICTPTFYVFLAFLGVIIILYRRKIRNRIIDSHIFFFIISGLGSVGLVLFAYTDARVGSWASLMGIVGILYLLNQYWPSYWASYRKSNVWIGIFLLAVTYVHWIAVDYYVIQIRRVFLDGIERYVKTPHKTVFAKVIDKNEFLLITANMPDVGIFSFGSSGINEYYSEMSHMPSARKFAFIPDELRNACNSNSYRIPGTAKMRYCNGRYYGPMRDFDGFTSLNIYYDGKPRKTLVCLYPFVSEKDGKEYMHYYIYNNWIEYHFKEITAIDL